MYQDWNQTLLSTMASGAAVTASGSPTDIMIPGDYTFPANFFYPGFKFRISALGIASTTTGSNTLTFGVYLGSTLINAAFGAITFIASQTNQKWRVVIDCECRVIGISTNTTFVCQGIFQCSPALLATGIQMLPASGTAAAGTGVDWTATQKLSTQVTWSAASNSLTCEQYEVAALN